MLELLEKQINVLNNDEDELEEKLNFVGDSVEAVLLSRRDTFKE